MMRTILVLLLSFSTTVAQDPAGEIRLLVRVDDMGAALAMNEACIRTCKDGIGRSAEVIVPGPWLLDAVGLLKENPQIDVGIHLCLTSEWERVKWRPLTASPSLVDRDGHFYPMTRQRKDFPPGTGFVDAKPDLGEVERELRAQIDLLKRHLPRLSHVSTHMGAATATPELAAVTRKLAKEYGLRLMPKELKRLPAIPRSGDREKDMVALLEKLEPGTYMLVEHPGLDTPEMRAMGHIGYTNVAEDRASITQALTSDRVKELVNKRGIKLISYADLPLD